MNREDVVEEFEKKALSATVLKFCPNELTKTRLDKDTNLYACGYNSNLGLDIIPIEANMVMFDNFELVGVGATEEKALNDLINKDNILVYNLLLNTCNLNTPLDNEIVNYSEGMDYKDTIERAQYQVEKNRLLVDKFLVTRPEIGMFKKHINAIDHTPIRASELLEQGLFGSLWGVQIILMDFITWPLNIMFAVTEGRYLGIRTITSIIITDEFKGDVEFKVTGQMGIVNPRAISCMIDNKYVSKSINFDVLQKKWNDVNKSAQEKFNLIVAR